MAFTPCPDCARHVRVDEGACPFCGSASARPAPKTPRRLPTRATRAAIFFAGVLGTSACGDDEVQTIYGGPPVTQGDDDDPGSVDIYGGPSVEDEPPTQQEPEEEQAPEPPPPVPAYGAPPPSPPPSN